MGSSKKFEEMYGIFKKIEDGELKNGSKGVEKILYMEIKRMKDPLSSV